MTDEAIPEQLEAARDTFTEATARQATEFARSLLQQIPELESVIIVPVWQKETPGNYDGITVGRYGALQTPGEVARASAQLYQTLRHQLEKQWGIFVALRENIQKLEAQYDAAHAAQSSNTHSEQPPAS